MGMGDLDRHLMQFARQTLGSSSDPAVALPEGVRLMDTWQTDRFGGVLFWLDMDLDRNGWGATALHDALLAHGRDGWRPMAAGEVIADTAERLAAEKGPGVHKLGVTSVDPVRLVTAFASPEVTAIELRSVRGSAWRRPGADGFCLMGITHGDQVASAHAVDRDGHQVGDELLLF
jgi:hypothetical protein